jgi:hypothetical protein
MVLEIRPRGLAAWLDTFRRGRSNAYRHPLAQAKLYASYIPLPLKKLGKKSNVF